MAVEEMNPELVKMGYYWKLVRDFVQGEYVVKQNGRYYLPVKAGQSEEDYFAYKARAKIPDYTEQALRSMHGMILRRTPIIDVPESDDLKKCIEDFDKEGHSLYQHASTTLYDNVQTTFGGMLADMPQYSSDVTTKADADKKGIRPYARYYPAESIVNYKYYSNNSARELRMVVLKEEVEAESADEFSHAIRIQYRVLDLDDFGTYRVRIFRKVEEYGPKSKKPTFEQTYENYVYIDGKTLDYIPFYFMPDIRPITPERPILYGIAELNKHYYMQSADYENGVHFTTIPTLWTTGHDMGNGAMDDNEDILKLGGDSALNLPEADARIGTVQFAGDGLTHAKQAKEETVEQIGIIGTRALSPDKAMGETSDAARIHRAGENARLATYTRNVSECYTKVLQTMADWLGVKGKVNVQFNVDFDTVAFDPNALNSIANLSREGKYPLPLVFEALKKGEYMPNDITLEQFMLLIELEAGDITPSEELKVWQKIRNGEKITLETETSVKEFNENRSDNDKKSEDTKQVSMENGR